jgi:hypothetical protein
MVWLVRLLITLLAVAALFVISGPASSAFMQVHAGAIARKVDDQPLQLDVQPALQSEPNSCGEAAILMAYNYAYPQAPIDEAQIIRYAKSMGYYTPRRFPFTSPDNMVRIAQNFARRVASGHVFASDQGLALLDRKLQEGTPVIIDILTRLYDPEAGAHFVVVTGLSVDPERGNAIMVHYNDPLSGGKYAARWAGNEGLWNAWRNNGDPGGSGWWMVISPSSD